MQSKSMPRVFRGGGVVTHKNSKHEYKMVIQITRKSIAV